jgi:hypothetical protein
MPTDEAEEYYQHEKMVEQHTASLICAVQDEPPTTRVLFYKAMRQELDALIASGEQRDDDEG